MATIVLGGAPARVIETEVQTDADQPVACAVRMTGWSAIDRDSEQRVEIRLNRKLTLKQQWHDWLLNYNRH